MSSSSTRLDPIKKLKTPYVKPTFSQLTGTFNPSTSSNNNGIKRQRSNDFIGSSSSSNTKRINRDSGIGLMNEDEEDDVEDSRGGGGGGGRGREVSSFSVWNVQWRNFQAKKHKTWDGDGVLLVNGTKLTLRNDDGKIIGNGTLAKPIEDGQEFKVGSRDIQIEDEMTPQEYFNRFGEHIPNPTPSFTPSRPTASITSTATRVQLPPNVNPYPKPKALIPPLQASIQTPKAGPSNLIVRDQLLMKGKGKEMEVDLENFPPQVIIRKESKKVGGNLDDDDDDEDDRMIGISGALSSGEEGEGLEDSVKSPRSNQRRISGSIPLDSSNRVQSLEKDSLLSDREIAEEKLKKEVEARREAKGKGKEVFVEPKKIQPMAKIIIPTVLKPVEPEIKPRYYSCQWRPYTIKKQPVWEGDGIMIVTGKQVILKDKETRKELSRSDAAGRIFFVGDNAQIGKKTIEIESLMDEKEYLEPASQSLSRVLSSVPNFFTPIIKLPPHKFMDPIYGGKAGKGKTPMPRFPPDAEGAIVMTRPTPEHEEKFNKKKLPIVDVVIDPLISGKLRPHQAEGVKFMYESVMGMRTEGQGCILADEMGLGKTIQAIALLYTLLKQSPYFGNGTVIERAVIVCPVTLVKNWSAEIKKWLGRDRLNVFLADEKSKISTFIHSRSFQVLIIGYERLRTVMKDLEGIQPPIGLVICDEGHRLKSSNAQVTKALKLFSTPRRIILSGTPIQNDLSEFHSMVDFIIPGILDSYSVFKKFFEVVILKSREPKASSAERKIGTARQEQLYRVSQKFILRRTADVIKKYLPPKFEFTVFIIPTKLQLALYARILEGSAVRDVLSGSGGQQLSLLMMLRSLSNTPGLLLNQIRANKSPDILTGSVVSLFPKNADPNDFSLSGKLLVVGSLLEELRKRGEEKIVVVSNFTTTLDIIGEHCKKMKYPFRRLDGSTPQGDRIPMVNDFNRGMIKNNFVFLLSSKSGGTGLNIVGASRLVLIDSDWNPSTDAQAMARIHREGQTKPCYIYRFLTSGTMDEKIFQRQVTKVGLSTSLMDDESAIGAGKGDAFTNDDLRSIFKLHDDVICQTHDLLGCKCLLSSNDISDQDDEEEEFEEEIGFTQASQMPANFDRERKDRKNLSLLKEWVHYDCSDESAVDELQDEVLREVAFIRVAEAPDEEASTLASSNIGIPLKGGNIGFAFFKKSG